LDGFTITGGNADNFTYRQPDNGFPIPAGTPMHADASAILLAQIEADIVNCRIEKNSSHRDAVILISAIGAAGQSSLTTFQGCVIRENRSTGGIGNGAGIMVEDYPEVRLSDCFFEGNRGAKGAALNIYSSRDVGAAAPRVAVVDCEFRENVAEVSPDLDADGYLDYGTGGAIYANGGGAQLFIGTTVFDNNAVDAKGLIDPTLQVTRGSGGAVFIETGAEAKVVNSVFYANQCQGNGGAIGVAQWMGIPGPVASVSLYHCTFTKNRARWGGGVDNFRAQLSGRGNIFYDNWSIEGYGYVSDVNNGISSDGPSASSLLFSLTSLGTIPGNIGTGIVAGNPCFVSFTDPDGATGGYGDGDDGLQIRHHSPAKFLVDVDLPQDFADLDGDFDFIEPLPWDFSGQPFVSRPYHAGAYQVLAQ